MQRLKTLNEIYQKRLIRPEYAHHQATPYAAALDPSFFNSDGSIRVPASSDTAGAAVYTGGPNAPLTRSAAANTLNSSLTPGLVLIKVQGGGESLAIATGVQNATEQPFGLLANWVGGDFDEIGPNNVGSGVIGAWRGPDSTYTILAPGFNDAGTGNTNGQSLSTAISGAVNTGAPVKLYAGVDGRLFSCSSATGTMVVVAHLLDRPSASRIVIDLKI